MKKQMTIGSWQFVVFALGVLTCLVAGFLMGWGEEILGENHSGIAAVIGIVGIGIISNANRMSSSEKTKGREA